MLDPHSDLARKIAAENERLRQTERLAGMVGAVAFFGFLYLLVVEFNPATVAGYAGTVVGSFLCAGIVGAGVLALLRR